MIPHLLILRTFDGSLSQLSAPLYLSHCHPSVFHMPSVLLLLLFRNHHTLTCVGEYVCVCVCVCVYDFGIMPSFSLQKLRWEKETVRVRTKDTVCWSNKYFSPASSKDLQQIMEIMPPVNTAKTSYNEQLQATYV